VRFQLNLIEHEPRGSALHLSPVTDSLFRRKTMPNITTTMAHSSLERRQILKSAGALLACSVFGGGTSTAWEQSESTGQQNIPFWHKGMIGFQLAFEQFPIAELLELGVEVERAGFDVLSASDHLQPWQANEGHASQAWIGLAAIGQRTHKVIMGTTVTCPTFRYSPAVVAEAFASLNFLTPGRIFLGLGSGEALNEQAATGLWPKWPERSERLVEATDIIRKLWSGGHVDHTGKYYQTNMRLYDAPQSPIPLFMAGNGPKAMNRVGRYADGLITDPKTWKEHKSEFESGAKAGGKDPKAMPVLIEQYVVVGDKKDAEKSARLWRFGPKAWKPYFNVRDPEEIERRANTEIPLEEVYKEWPVSTDPEVHVKAIRGLFDGGATEVHIHSGQEDQKRVIQFYGKEVLPRLRRASAA
jgi:TAT-translocated FGD2 family F420-dependent dehydrogenase